MLAALAMLVRLVEYETSCVALARREIRKWADAAAAIPDPALRRLATEAIAVDASNAEAAAAFATIAPRRQRRATAELLVANQILVDYVDMLGEWVCADALDRGLATNMALAAAVTAPPSMFRLDLPGDDAGYLLMLVTTCRGRFWQLPSASIVEQAAEAAAARCAHALAYTHAAIRKRTSKELRHWATGQSGTARYSWWETAAGGNSSLAVLALLAAAADPLTTHHDVAAIASAYWPHVCVMSTLLDSLVDYERDGVSGNFSFVSHYPSVSATQDGVIRATRCSLAAVRPLRHSHTHTMIVCGVAGYYAAAAAPGSLAAQIAPSLNAELGPSAMPIVVALRARHRSPRRP